MTFIRLLAVILCGLQDGQYTFWTISNDRSDLHVDGVRVVFNEDYNENMIPKIAMVNLTAGPHAFQARVFQV